MRWWRNPKRENDLERELQSHLEAEAEETHGDLHAARRTLGNVTAIKEDVRRAWGGVWLDQLASDLRYTVRTLAQSPGFAAIAILSLALGMGAATAIFSVVNGVLLRPLPYPEPEQLVRLWESNPTRGASRNVVNGWNFSAWRERSHTFEAMAAIQQIPMNLTGQGEPVSISGMLVTSDFFPALHVDPMLGRAFRSEEETPGRDGLVVLSYALYQSRFGGNPAALGQSIRINGASARILGVMPPGFGFPDSKAELWMPMRIDHSPEWERGRSLATVARLKPGVTVAQAQQELTAVAQQLSRERPDYDRDWSAEVIPILQDTTQGVRRALLVLLAAVGFLLAIACANVANLFLIRGAGRSREVALRETLGASRVRLFRQFLTESLVVSSLAGLLGVAIARFGLQALLRLVPPNGSLPRRESIALDARVFTVALGITVLTALLFGLVPLLHGTRTDLQSPLRLRTQTASKRFRRIFVTAQVALAVVLLVGAGLMTRSFARILAVNPGFATGRLLALDIFPSPARFAERRALSNYHEKILAAVRATPGVESASSIHFLPLEQRASASCFGPGEGPAPIPSQAPSADYLVVGPQYLATMRIPLLRGREFSAQDRFASPDVVVVNRAFAEKYLRSGDPVGKRIQLCWEAPSAQVIGVADDALQRDLRDPARPTIFIANAQAPNYFATIVVRAAQDPRQIARSVIAAIHGVNPEEAVTAVRTMEEVRNESVARPRLQFVLLFLFAAVALVLAAIGMYGVVSYSVAQRTHEIGIRVAVGASRTNIAVLVLQEGVLLAAGGVALGLAGALALTRYLESLLFETAPADPVTLVSVCGLLLLVTALAIAAPLRRSTRVDPVVALRYE